MQITILALRFEAGSWRDWDHKCHEEELDSVTDSANAKAFDHGRPGKPTYFDF